MRPRRASINGETRRTVANDRLSRGLLDQVPGYLQVLPKLLRREGEHAAVVISMAGDFMPCVCNPAEKRRVTLSHRSEEHTSELQSLMRISYAVFCLKKKHTRPNVTPQTNTTDESIASQHRRTRVNQKEK